MKKKLIALMGLITTSLICSSCTGTYFSKQISKEEAKVIFNTLKQDIHPVPPHERVYPKARVINEFERRYNPEGESEYHEKNFSYDFINKCLQTIDLHIVYKDKLTEKHRHSEKKWLYFDENKDKYILAHQHDNENEIKIERELNKDEGLHEFNHFINDHDKTIEKGHESIHKLEDIFRHPDKIKSEFYYGNETYNNSLMVDACIDVESDKPDTTASLDVEYKYKESVLTSKVVEYKENDKQVYYLNYSVNDFASIVLPERQ